MVHVTRETVYWDVQLVLVGLIALVVGFGLPSVARAEQFGLVWDAAEQHEGLLRDKYVEDLLLDSGKAFGACLTAFGGGEWSEAEASFAWTLHSGDNCLEVRFVNAWGLPGIVSAAVIRYTPPGSWVCEGNQGFYGISSVPKEGD